MLEYLNSVLNNVTLHPQWRIGQAYFNTLRMEYPGLAEEVRGTHLDPFYCESPHDPTIVEFLIWFGDKINES